MDRALLKLLDPFPWSGFERSVKLSPQTILWNRFLVGVNKSAIPPAQLERICSEVQIPAVHWKTLQENVGRSNQVLFGFEESDRATVYKVYLEFWTEVTAAVRSGENKTEPRLLHLGFKWDPKDSSKATVTRYTCFPLLGVRDTAERIDALYGGNHEQTGWKATLNLLKMASQRAPNASFVYMEAEEESNPRKSFDVNLYKASIKMPELRALAHQTANDYAIPPGDFVDRFSALKKNTFGHVAGGVDRHGRDFLTFYYEDNRPGKTVVQQSSAPGRNDPCPCGSGKKTKKCCGGAAPTKTVDAV